MNPLGTLALSDALEADAANPHGFHAAIFAGPGRTLGENVVRFVTGAAANAKAYGCSTLFIWTGFGGERNPAVGYNCNVLDAAEGITLRDVNDAAAAIAAQGVRPGIIIRPQRIVQGVNRPYIDCSDPVGTLLAHAAAARACGFMDFYVDSNCGECMAVDNKALEPERFNTVTDAFPDATFLTEFWNSGYAESPSVIHWRGSAKTFTSDRPQAVQLAESDVKSKAQQAAWGKRLHDTGSTVLINCRPDDPTLPGRQAPVLAAWRVANNLPA